MRLQSDNCDFIKCRFTNCIIEYSGGDVPGFQDCEFDSCEFLFTGPALHTVQYLHMLYHGGFSPIVDAMFDQIKQRPPKE